MKKTPPIIIFDVDGVLIRPPYYFSAILEQQGYEKASEVLNDFYQGAAQHACLTAQARVEDNMQPYLEKFGWKGTVEEYLKKQFAFESKYLDQGLLELVKALRGKGVKCYLCTDQEKFRASQLLNQLNFKSLFDQAFISLHAGSRKCKKEFWEYVLKEIKKEFPKAKAEEIIFFDDLDKNVEAAEAAGFQAVLFKNKEQFLRDLGEWLEKN